MSRGGETILKSFAKYAKIVWKSNKFMLVHSPQDVDKELPTSLKAQWYTILLCSIKASKFWLPYSNIHTARQAQRLVIIVNIINTNILSLYGFLLTTAYHKFQLKPAHLILSLPGILPQLFILTMRSSMYTSHRWNQTCAQIMK